MQCLPTISTSLFYPRGLRLLMAVLVGGVLAGLLPLSAMTTFVQPLLPAAAADMTVSVLTAILPQPLPALAADDDTDLAPTVLLGNRLWLEDDFDGNAATGIVKPVGAGYVVRATASDGVTVYSATTDANGLYKLTVPANDTYIVTTDLPAGMFDAPVVTATGQNPAANDNRNHNRLGTTVVVTTSDNLSIDFGFFHWEKRVTLGDRLWLEDDNDGNAATGTVSPIGPGHVVTAVASDGSTTYSGVTDANGYYIILVPENDTYTVRTNQPAGVSDTPVWTNNGSNSTLHNDKNHDRLGTSVVMTITDNLSIDFGFYTPPPPPRTVNLGNYVWFDSNSDGVQNEPPSQGRDGITITLTYPNNSTITTVTANGGYYTFTNLAPNQQYIVTFVLPDGLVFTTPDQGGNDATDSDAPSNGQVIVNLGATDDYTIDAGLVEAPPEPELVMLGDYVWEDLNGNGQQESNEPGIPGVSVSLTWPNGTTVVTTTNASGFYHFTPLLPNTTYTVTFGTPAGYTPTSANTGADATDSDPVQGKVIVPLGNSDDLTIDAGFIRPVTVGDRVWYDNNHNGRQDSVASERGVTGVLATLYNAATNQPILHNGAPLTDQTDASGEYLFTNLPPGAYFVVFSNLPAGYQPTLRNIGDDAGDSDADANGRTAATPFLPSGSVDRTLDMGIWRAPASLGDFVWADANSNGLQDQGESGLSGVTVTLNGPTGTATTTTDAGGHYTFTNLLPGVVYTVTFATPSGYAATLTNSGSNDAGDSDGTIVAVPPLQPGEHNPTIDSGFIRLLPDLVLIKQAMTSAPSIQRGAIVTYTLTYRNQGNGVATNVVITETVSAHTTFAAQKSSAGWSCNNGAPAGSQCRYSLGDLQPGQSGVIIFAIKIDADVAAGTQVVNVAVIGTTLIEGESENNKDQSTITLVGPTDLTETQEPGALNFRLYLPVATK
ncbi:MAG: DUF11 domain-containing protein [Caldilinea sp. CFX5]|nr:DUF11 domain-containing protein [Caldilinea sp. CFX5]